MVQISIGSAVLQFQFTSKFRPIYFSGV